jgi:hypothetical protein
MPNKNRYRSKSRSKSTKRFKTKTPKQKAKVKKVMEEFKLHKLKSRSGNIVKDRKQAIAIALSEAKKL